MGNTAIKIVDLVQDYEGAGQALRGVSLEIEKGEFVALIGQNGAGKTTLVKHLNGLLRPVSGSIELNGMDISQLKTSELARIVGYLFQNPDHQIFMDRVDKEVAFGPTNLGLSDSEVADRTRLALEKVGIGHLADRSPMTLSRGQRQRVALASVLAMEPEILVLDEPTTGQDHREGLQIMDFVEELNGQGHTVLFITHDMQLVARYAKRTILMCGGRILCDGPTRYVLSQTALLAQTYVRPPQITLLGQMMSGHGLPGDAMSVDELLDAIPRTDGAHGPSMRR